jgi:hypothetical protein
MLCSSLLILYIKNTTNGKIDMINDTIFQNAISMIGLGIAISIEQNANRTIFTVDVSHSHFFENLAPSSTNFTSHSINANNLF